MLLKTIIIIMSNVFGNFIYVVDETITDDKSEEKGKDDTIQVCPDHFLCRIACCKNIVSRLLACIIRLDLIFKVTLSHFGAP